MRKISGQLVWSKPVSLSRAAKLISKFAAVDNGSSPTVSLYLQRAAESFNHLAKYHKDAEPTSIQIEGKKRKKKNNADDVNVDVDGVHNHSTKKKKKESS